MEHDDAIRCKAIDDLIPAHRIAYQLQESRMIRFNTLCMRFGVGRPRHRQQGQGMMEYIIIVALIAVAAIGIYSAWGKTTRLQSAGIAREMAGKSADMPKVQDAANAAAGRANDPQKAGMAGYNFANDQN